MDAGETLLASYEAGATGFGRRRGSFRVLRLENLGQVFGFFRTSFRICRHSATHDRHFQRCGRRLESVGALRRQPPAEIAEESNLVVALMIAPPATVYLLTNRLSVMLGLSTGIGGYWLARLLGANIAGAMATMTGIFFLLTSILAPERGLIARQVEATRRKRCFAIDMLLVPLSRRKNSLEHIRDAMRWQVEALRNTVRRAQQDGLIERQNAALFLTDEGRRKALLILARQRSSKHAGLQSL